MKNFKSLMLVTASFILSLQTNAVAQTNAIQQVDQTNYGRTSVTRAGNMDGKTVGTMIRASQLIGRNIENTSGKSVGEINDLAIDARTGEVSYAAVTYGGWLGIGDNMYAVPMAAFQFSSDPDDKDQTILVLDVTPEQLEGETGFDQSTWPNVADKTFLTETNQRYGLKESQSNFGESSESTYTKNHNRSELEDHGHNKHSDK